MFQKSQIKSDKSFRIIIYKFNLKHIFFKENNNYLLLLIFTLNNNFMVYNG